MTQPGSRPEPWSSPEPGSSDAGWSDAAWVAWLRTLSDAAQELARRLDAGEPAEFVDLPGLPPDAGPLPAPLHRPAQELLADLDVLGRRVSARRDDLRRQLVALAVPRHRRGTSAACDVGRSLDIAG